MSVTDTGVRDAKGEWRPADPAAYVPLWNKPWRLPAVLKWIVGYPGFVLPFNLIMLGITVGSWFLTQPALARCAAFQWDWMLQIYVRNLALIWLWYGAHHLWLYIWKKEGTNGKYDRRWPAQDSRVFLFQDQVYDNVFWTAGVAGLIWTAYECATMWLYANGRLPYLSWAAHPVWGVVWFIGILFWREFHFYWVHRLVHTKPLYKHVHYLHHKNVNPNPWSGMAMHPVETILYLSVCVIHWVIPSHPIHIMFTLIHAGLAPAGGHDGFEGPLIKGKFPAGSYFHYLHHRYFECNYGEALIPLDRWFGTFRDGLPQGAGANLPEEQKD